MENLKHDICKLAVAQTCRHLQWNAVKSSALEVLSELVERYIMKIGHLSLELAIISHRDAPTIEDVLMALSLMKSDFNELGEFARHYRAPAFKYLLDSIPTTPTCIKVMQPWESEDEVDSEKDEDDNIFDNDDLKSGGILDSRLPFINESSSKRMGALARRFSTSHAVRAFRGLPKLSRLASNLPQIDTIGESQTEPYRELEQPPENLKFPRIKFRLPAMPLADDEVKQTGLVDVSHYEEDVAIMAPKDSFDQDMDASQRRASFGETEDGVTTYEEEYKIDRTNSREESEKIENTVNFGVIKEEEQNDGLGNHEVQHSTPMSGIPLSGDTDPAQEALSHSASHRLSFKIRFKPIAESPSPAPPPQSLPEEPIETEEVKTEPTRHHSPSNDSETRPPTEMSVEQYSFERQEHSLSPGAPLGNDERRDSDVERPSSSAEPSHWYPPDSPAAQMPPSPPPFQLSPPAQPFQLSPPAQPFQLSPPAPPVVEEPQPAPPKLGLGLKLKIKIGAPPEAIGTAGESNTVAPEPESFPDVDNEYHSDWSEHSGEGHFMTGDFDSREQKSGRKRKSSFGSGSGSKKRAVEYEPLKADQLIEVKTPAVAKPRPPSATSIPAILKMMQDEWDAVMLHAFTLRQQLQTARQELSHALYQHDAACRVIARLNKEVTAAREALATLKPQAGISESYHATAASAAAHHHHHNEGPAAGAHIDVAGINDEVMKKLQDMATLLTGERKKRGKTVPEGLASAEDIQRYNQLSSHVGLHSASSPGILCLDLCFRDSSRIATGGNDKNVAVFNKETQQVVAILKGHTKKVTSVVYHPVEDVVISSSPDETVRVWSVKDAQCNHSIRAHDSGVTGISLHPTGDFVLASSTDASWSFSDIRAGRVLAKVYDEAAGRVPLTCCQFHPDGLIFATGTEDSQVKVWDLKDQANVANFAGHSGPITCLAFSENGYYLATAGTDSVVKLWDLRKLKNFKTLSPGGEDSSTPINGNYEILSMCFDNSGNYLAVAGTDVRIYLVKQWQELRTFTDHTAHATGVRFGNSAQFVATTSMDRSLKFFGI